MTEFAARPGLADAERKIVQLVMVEERLAHESYELRRRSHGSSSVANRAEGEMAPLQAAAPRPAARRRAAPAPIRVKSDRPRLTSGFGALGSSLKASGNGEWKEF